MSQERFASCSLRDFLLEEELSRGSNGSIWKAKFKYDGRHYALKELKLTGKMSQRAAFKEAELLRQLDHRNCVRCYGHFVDDSRKLFFIVLEYCEGGDLSHLIENQKRMSKYLEETYIWSMFHQICLGVQHLHQLGIVHRDLKTSNIFLVDNNTPKVGDLGVSYQVTENIMHQSFSGTPLYLSPELVRGEPYNEKTDIWSLGIVLYELCTFSAPFAGATLLNLAQAIDAADIPPLPSIYSSKLEKTIRWLLQRDYTHRPSIAQVVEKVSKQVLRIQLIETPPAGKKNENLEVLSCASPSIASSLQQMVASESLHTDEDSIVIDLHRLTILEKRDKLTLRKLQQTKTLSNSPISPNSDGLTVLDDRIRTIEKRLHLLEGAISSGGRIEKVDAERSLTLFQAFHLLRLGLLSNRGESNEMDSRLLPKVSQDTNTHRGSDNSSRSSSVKIRTALLNDDKPGEHIFRAEKQRQSVFASPRKAAAVSPVTDRRRETSSQSANSRARAPRFNVITGREY